jgi:hypothetical protein
MKKQILNTYMHTYIYIYIYIHTYIYIYNHSVLVWTGFGSVSVFKKKNIQFGYFFYKNRTEPNRTENDHPYNQASKMFESFFVHFILYSVSSKYRHFRNSCNTHKKKWWINELLTICVQEEVHIWRLIKRNHPRKGRETNLLQSPFVVVAIDKQIGTKLLNYKEDKSIQKDFMCYRCKTRLVNE